jgi:beta-aspartyl-peptidase (threonine type)
MQDPNATEAGMNSYAMAIHGGAGTILRSKMDAVLESAYRASLKGGIAEGEKVLRGGGSALDAVEAAVKLLEDNPLFNAGCGSVFTHEGVNEMDASIMDGRNLKCGSVAALKLLKNPVSLARAIMEKSPHVFMSGSGAADFASSLGLTFMPAEYFFVQERYDQLQEAIKSDKVLLDHTEPMEGHIGTVGAVALDKHGNLAAATSTGGMTNKKHGRVGDTPIIGSGTYANNKTCAISCTGHGEYFIRAVAAHDVSCLMEYGGFGLREACELVVRKKLVNMGGEGGLIAVDAKGNIELCFNSVGMYRASVREGDEIRTGIFSD